MSLWVKICANTSLEDARLAVEAGADALGFVFAPSPRRVTPEHVAAITPQLPESIDKIGVFVDAALEEIIAAIRTCGLTGVQLHSASGAELPAQLRAEFGPGLRILRVVHFGPNAAEQAQAYAADANVDGVLVDSRTATAVGGTGIAFDWAEARRTVFGGDGAARLVAAGGLNPDNVAEAIGLLKPWGVDVASGVEAAPGRKDPAKVRAFVANVRAASI
ncbi:MAG TPA: phosphoribosylanthranilate isomerase [Terracidiphilus sp.]|jgi:phosphoribosylanthranilate isomerase|nr:phosphoribosylanthranilate isomerase [Terracidiphilus sp.]